MLDYCSGSDEEMAILHYNTESNSFAAPTIEEAKAKWEAHYGPMETWLITSEIACFLFCNGKLMWKVVSWTTGRKEILCWVFSKQP